MRSFSEWLAGAGGATAAMVSVAVMMLFGFGFTRITKLLKLPNVTGYVLAGIVIGPYCLDMIPPSVIEGTDFLSDIALSFIAFGVGEFFRISTLRRCGGKTVVITLFEALAASAAVFAVSFWALGLDLGFSLVLAALASATAPASTMMTIRQTRARGEFVDVLLQVVAYDDGVSLVAYAAAIAVVGALGAAGSVSAGSVLLPVLYNIAALVLGAAFGFLLKILLNHRSTDNRLIVTVAVLFTFCGICAAAGTSPLLGCMAMGATYINLTDDNKLFKQLNYFSPPVLLLFFVRSGANFRLDALFDTSTLVGSVPLALVSAAYFVSRIAGKYAGAFVGCAVAKTQKQTRNYLGFALVPQAGVAIGLAAIGARTLGGSLGTALNTVILASSVLYELIGPACAKFALFKSGSIPKKEDKPDETSKKQSAEKIGGKPAENAESIEEKVAENIGETVGNVGNVEKAENIEENVGKG